MRGRWPAARSHKIVGFRASVRECRSIDNHEKSTLAWCYATLRASNSLKGVIQLIKQDVVHKVAERTGLPRVKAEAAVDTVFLSMKNALAAGDRIELRGFGVFSVKPRKTGIGRNPEPEPKCRSLPAALSVSSRAKNCICSTKFLASNTSCSRSRASRPRDLPFLSGQALPRRLP